jgi:hypothetical protein
MVCSAQHQDFDSKTNLKLIPHISSCEIPLKSTPCSSAKSPDLRAPRFAGYDPVNAGCGRE